MVVPENGVYPPNGHFNGDNDNWWIYGFQTNPYIYIIYIYIYIYIYIGSLAGVCLSSALSGLSLSQPVSSTHQPKHTTNNSTRPIVTIVDKNNHVQTKYSSIVYTHIQPYVSDSTNRDQLGIAHP